MNGSLVLTICVDVTWTTPGASCRKMSLIVSALPGRVSNEVGELPPSAGWICRTVVVLLPTPNAEAPASEIAPPTRPAANSATTGSTCVRAGKDPVITTPRCSTVKPVLRLC